LITKFYTSGLILGEVGLFVCAIWPGKVDFDGYKGRKELNEKKILRNVLKAGDMYYNSSDLLMTDKMHNVYFRDRVGDTFRWVLHIEHMIKNWCSCLKLFSTKKMAGITNSVTY
jgi:hypothetical protein